LLQELLLASHCSIDFCFRASQASFHQGALLLHSGCLLEQSIFMQYEHDLALEGVGETTTGTKAHMMPKETRNMRMN
jgi:hypothetical protein